MSAETAGTGTKLAQIDQQVQDSAYLAQALVSIARGAKTPALTNLDAHARSVLGVCYEWPPTKAEVEAVLTGVIPLPDSARTTLPTASPTELQQFSDTLTRTRGQFQEAERRVHEFNAHLGDAVATLNADATAVAAELKDDQQNLDNLNARMQQINEDYEPSVGHVFKWIGEGVVSAGIWPAIELEEAQDEAGSLTQQFQETEREMQELEAAEGPLGGLLASLQLLEGDLLNMAAAAEEADNIMKTVVQTRQELTDTGDPFYQDTLNELYDHLGRLRDQALYILQG